MRYRKKPVVIDAVQWMKQGDAPDIKVHTLEKACAQCGRDEPESHGWIETLEGGHIVCPTDFIITGIKGEKYPCKADVFEQTYDAVDDFRAADDSGPRAV